MDRRPDDLDAARGAVAARGLTGTASGHLTSEVAMALPFEDLAPFKTLLKRFFSTEPWMDSDAEALSDLVAPHLEDGWWEHRLDDDLQLGHGVRSGRYMLWVTGVADDATRSIFDRVFTGPVIPEPTPHPRKVKFATGGTPAPGIWYRRSDPEPSADPRVRRVFEEPDVSDVMVAGDFVTVGLDRSSNWEQRLDDVLALITERFAGADTVATPARTREELLDEGRSTQVAARPEELHLLDPDDAESRERLVEALTAGDARVRRVAVAVLAESTDPGVRRAALRTGWADRARIVQRTAVDSAADTEDEALRDLLENALASADAWVRWKAVRTLGELGVARSRQAVAALTDDPDFQVRFEAAKVLRDR